MTEMANTALTSKQAAASLGSSITSKTTYGAAAGTTIMGFEMQEFGVICGIVIAIVTLCFNVYYQRQKHKLDVLLAQAQLEKTATAALDKTQTELLSKVKEQFYADFGDSNKRSGEDRRKNSNPNYNGVERRKGPRRESPVFGDSDEAKEMRAIFEITKQAADRLKELEEKHAAKEREAENA